MQFGAIIYNASRVASEELNQELEGFKVAAKESFSKLQELESVGKANSLFLQHERFEIVVDSICRGNRLNRSENKKDGGAMMSTVGTTQTFGSFSQNRGVVPPRPNKCEEIELVEELRTNAKLYLPSKRSTLFPISIAVDLSLLVWQAFDHAFLEGFLPEMAQEFLVRLLTRHLPFFVLIAEEVHRKLQKRQAIRC